MIKIDADFLKRTHIASVWMTFLIAVLAWSIRANWATIILFYGLWAVGNFVCLQLLFTACFKYQSRLMAAHWGFVLFTMLILNVGSLYQFNTLDLGQALAYIAALHIPVFVLFLKIAGVALTNREYNIQNKISSN